MACAEDEFYDAVVGMCSKCSDVCFVANHFCVVNCPGYARRVFSSTADGHVVTSPMSVKTKAAAAPSKHNETLRLLVTKPLFWTSVISLFISVVATTVLIVLCVCRRRPSTTHRRPLRNRLFRLSAPSRSQLPPAAQHNGKTVPDSRLAVDNIYSEYRRGDDQPGRGHTTSALSKQDSCIVADGDECVSLCSDNNRHVATHGESFYNISHIPGRPQSSRISWIDVERSVKQSRDVHPPPEECSSWSDEVTKLNAADCRDFERGRDGGPRRREVDKLEQSVQTADYSTIQRGQVDSGTSSLTKPSSTEDDTSDVRRTDESKVRPDAVGVVAISVGGENLRELWSAAVVRNDDDDDDDRWPLDDHTQLKQQVAERVKSAPPASREFGPPVSIMSNFSVQCSS